jgi:glycosyltransferase involved in cell wall biosynthesis
VLSAVRGAAPDPDEAAIVHDFFVTPGGAERCAVEFARLLPRATLHTSFFDPERFPDLVDRSVDTWPIQRLIGPSARFRSFLPLYAIYFGRLRLHRRLLLSSSIAFSKAARSEGGTHVSYVYTPMRYAWDLDTYLGGSSYGWPARVAARLVRPVLQRWDRATARRPDVIVAISEEVRRRIERVWRRRVRAVIYPPVDLSELALSERDDGYLLIASRLLAYRRVDLAVAACTRLGRRLIVAGDGPELGRLRAAAGPTIDFVGHVDRGDLIRLFERCHAYVLPGAEDFGIAPVEAMAAGKPVVAFAAAGALETVTDGESGVLFERQMVDDLVAAIERLETIAFDPARIRELASRFDVAHFRRRWRDLLAELGFGDLLAEASTGVDA